MKRLFPTPGRGNHGKPLHHGGHWRGSRARKSRGPVSTARSRQGRSQWAWASPSIIDLPQDAAEIFVADPTVANAVVRSPRKLYVIGMDAGQTSVFALDQQGRKIAALELSIGRGDPGEPAANSTRGDASGRDHRADDQRYDHPDRSRRFHRRRATRHRHRQRLRAEALWRWPFRRPRRWPAWRGGNHDWPVVNVLTIRARDQVMLKVTVAEVQRDIAKQLGITTSSLTASWGTFTQFNPFAINGVIASGGGIGYPPAPFPNTTALTAHNPANTLSATLQAFERYGVTRILAEPTVSAVSGESAKMTVGGEIPIPTAPSCTGNGVCQIGTEFKPYGVSLRFTPVVLAEGRILLHLATEVTEIDTQTAELISGTLVPGFLTRKNETTVEIPSGGSIASAGLLQTLSKQSINGLPVLLDLPILGALFRSNDYQKQETELMIIVTPYIVKPAKPDEIAKPTDGFADASDPQTWLLGRVNQLYASPGNPEAIKDYKGPVGFIQD